MEEIGIAPTATQASGSNTRYVKNGDVYLQYKKLQQQLEFLNTMEDYVVCKKNGGGIGQHYDEATLADGFDCPPFLLAERILN